jgi:hypothetical protein
VLGSTVALLWNWWGEQLSLKLAHEVALGLDESSQLFISHVVKVAGLADLFLLGEEVHFTAQLQSPTGGVREFPPLLLLHLLHLKAPAHDGCSGSTSPLIQGAICQTTFVASTGFSISLASV